MNFLHITFDENTAFDHAGVQGQQQQQQQTNQFLRHDLATVREKGFAKQMWVLPLDLPTHVISGENRADEIVVAQRGISVVPSFADADLLSSDAGDETLRAQCDGKILYVDAPVSSVVSVSPNFVAAARRLGTVALATSAHRMSITDDATADSNSAQMKLSLPVVLRCNAAAFRNSATTSSSSSQAVVVVMPMNYGFVSRSILPTCVVSLKRNAPLRIIKDCTQKIQATSSFLKGADYTAQPPLFCPAAAFLSGRGGGACIVTCDIGTHCDSPAHFIADGRTISDLTALEMMAPCCVIDITEKTNAALAAGATGDGGKSNNKKHHNVTLTVSDIEEYEKKLCRAIPTGAVVAMRSGWAKRFQNCNEYRNESADVGCMNFPAFSLEAAEYLIARGIAGLAVDTLSVDVGDSTHYPVHVAILSASRYALENCDFDSLPPFCHLVAAPLAVRNAPEAPTRVLAVE